MGIDINPSDVLRSADAVEATATRIKSGTAPPDPGNDGFQLSDAIRLFSSRLQETVEQAAAETRSTAEKMVASATIMRRVDDASSDVTRTLWSKVV